MSNIDKETKNMLIGACIGSVLGVAATSICFAAKRHKKSGGMEMLGKAMTHLGKALEYPKAALNHSCDAVEELKGAAGRHENKIADILDWTAASIHLWKKFRGGK